TFEGDTSSQVRPGRQYDTPRGDNLAGGGRQADAPRGVRLTPETSVETSVETPPPTSPESPLPQPRVALVREEEDRSAGKTNLTTAEALTLVDAAVALWEVPHRPPSKSERLRITERVAQALAEGARPSDVSEVLTRDLSPSQVRT